MSDLFAFSEGESGEQINDGGNDMYDGGNRVNVRVSGSWSPNLKYTQECGGPNTKEMTAVGMSDVTYLTCKITSPATMWFAYFESAGANINGFRTMGDLGADGGGHVKSGRLSRIRGTSGYYMHVHSASDPSINKLVLVPNTGWSQQTQSTTHLGNHELTGGGVKALLYVLFAGNNGKEYSEGEFQSVMNAVLGNCADRSSFGLAECLSVTHPVYHASGTGWLNNWDGQFRYECPSNQGIVSLYSVHHNGAEDRRWKLACGQLSEGSLNSCHWTSHTHWDGSWTLGYTDKLIVGIDSFHDNRREDRRFQVKYCSTSGVTMTNHQDDGSWRNGLDHELNYNLPGDRFLTRITSWHHNGAEDRQFKFSTVQLSTGNCR